MTSEDRMPVFSTDRVKTRPKNMKAVCYLCGKVCLMRGGSMIMVDDTMHPDGTRGAVCAACLFDKVTELEAKLTVHLKAYAQRFPLTVVPATSNPTNTEPDSPLASMEE